MTDEEWEKTKVRILALEEKLEALLKSTANFATKPENEQKIKELREELKKEREIIRTPKDEPNDVVGGFF